MNGLPKVTKKPIGNTNNMIKPLIAGVVASVVASVSLPATASTENQSVEANAYNNIMRNDITSNTDSSDAVILVKPSTDEHSYHYSHSSHASHASHYSCTPGSTC